MNLHDKRALVTGTSSGIGRLLALALARHGVRLAISARRSDPLEQLADEIAASGAGRPAVLPADLSVKGKAAGLAARALSALGEVDLLVNNAGVGIGGSQAVLGDDEMARALFETNFWSPLALTQALVPGMRARGSGVIVNVSSMAAVLPMPLSGHYGASKAALARATETLEMELRGSGIHVLHVLPGPVDTPMLAELKLVPGSEKVLARTPRGDAQTLVRKILVAIRRKQRTLVYPGPYALMRHLPTISAWFSRRMMRDMDGSDPRRIQGGSAGDAVAIEARRQFVQEHGTPPRS